MRPSKVDDARGIEALLGAEAIDVEQFSFEGGLLPEYGHDRDFVRAGRQHLGAQALRLVAGADDQDHKRNARKGSADGSITGASRGAAPCAVAANLGPASTTKSGDRRLWRVM